MRLLRGRRGVSSIVAVLVAVLMLGTFTAALSLMVQRQGESVHSGVETSQRIREKVREGLEAFVESRSGDTLSIRVRNVGSVTIRITRLLAVPDGGPPGSVSLGAPEPLMPMEERTLTVTLEAEYGRLGLLTERGNLFPVEAGSAGQAPPPPTFDFSVSVSPSSAAVTRGSSTTATVTVALLSGEAQTVSLSASGLPSGASASFNPSLGSPTFTSTLTISTAAGTLTGTYTIMIVGAAGGLTRTATYTLTVEEAPLEEATVTFSASGLGPDASGTLLTVDGEGYGPDDLPKSFTWTVGSSHSFSWDSPIGAGSGKRYVWASTAGLSSRRSGTITVPSGGGWVTATYMARCRLSISVSPPGGGTTEPSPGEHWYDAGEEVKARVYPESGYAFRYWRLDGDRRYGKAIHVAMDAPHALRAYFEQVDGGDGGEEPDFRVSVSPSTITVQQGSSGSVTVTVTRVSGGSFTVSLSASGIPSGSSESFNPSRGSPTYSSTLTIDVGSTTSAGAYTITVKGTGAGKTRTASLTLVVTAPPPEPDFTVSVSPSTLTLEQGEGGSATVRVTRTSGGSFRVSLSASGLPSGATAYFSPSSGTPTYTSTLRVSTTSSTPEGTHTVTITGTGGGKTRRAYLTLRVKAEPRYVVNVYVQDYERYWLSGVRVTLSGSKGTFSDRTDSLGHVRFPNVPAGTYTLRVPSRAGTGFYRWSDGPTSRSRTITVSRNCYFTAVYKTGLRLRVVKAGKGDWGNFVASGWVESSHGNRVDGARVKATFYLQDLFGGRKTLSGSTYSRGGGQFLIDISSPLDHLWYGVVGAEVTASKGGYETATWSWGTTW